LAHGFGAKHWQARWNRGEIIGINDHLPYGYFWAAEDGCVIEHSEDKTEGWFSRFLRLAVRVVLGFDFIHAWRNRRGIGNAQIVWTHTESQYLAVLLLFQGWWPAARPKIIAQSVWLFDRWDKLPGPYRWLYRKLIAQADVLTVHSPENLKSCRALFPNCRSEMVPFGIRAQPMVPREHRPAHSPIRVLSLGNDRHRDWATLVGAVKGWDDCVLLLVSHAVDPALIRSVPNVEVTHPRNNQELMALYDWADIVVVAVKPNLHASGITVIQEATLCGLPVICTDTGGLRAYFRDGEVRFVASEQCGAIKGEIAALAADDAQRRATVERARQRMMSDGLTSRRFAQRHAELSRELLRTGVGWDDNRVQSGSFGTGAASDLNAFQRRLAGAALLAASIGFAPQPQASPQPDAGQGAALDLCAYRPTFAENFNSLSVSAWGENGSRWIAHTPWHGDFGDAEFVDPQPEFPFRVKDGVLEIEARKGPDGKWRSGLLASAKPDGSGFAQRFGYFELRAQLPSGPGVWPAFWLNANQPQGSKEPGVEIDVLEYYGQFTDGYHSVVHVWDPIDTAKSRHEDHITNVPPGALISGFHTYGVDVEKDWITFYFDRHET
jgi:glycosyltransferase involved in cell wall biosynthesis